mmetsp:Transcript_75104/g.87196  ORF Transcript_75104/g.87196 Transcript_75104/m.87196 type:complete len:84 (+) Transcript_75104:48-299(+)
METDLLDPTYENEKLGNKPTRLEQEPDCYFLEVRCPTYSCKTIMTVWSHTQSTMVCKNCQTTVVKPTGGKCKLTAGSAFRKKN